MQLKIKDRQEGDAVILELDGRLVFGDESDALRTAVKNHLNDGKKKIVLTLTKVNKIDSVGLGTVMGIVKSVRSAGARFHMVKPSRQVKEVFDLTGLGIRPDILPIFENEQEALKNF